LKVGVSLEVIPGNAVRQLAVSYIACRIQTPLSQSETDKPEAILRLR
jgi:hypothetical protein